jgi:hypothetical protein
LGGQKNIKDMDISPDCANQPLVLAKKGLNIRISFKFGPWSSNSFKSMICEF